MSTILFEALLAFRILMTLCFHFVIATLMYMLRLVAARCSTYFFIVCGLLWLCLGLLCHQSCGSAHARPHNRHSRWYWVNGCKSIDKLLISFVLVCVSNHCVGWPYFDWSRIDFLWFIYGMNQIAFLHEIFPNLFGFCAFLSLCLSRSLSISIYLYFLNNSN